jgi:hypothetical protein
MADEHEDQRSSFHWPPTTEELESIQVVEMHDGAPYKGRRPTPASKQAQQQQVWSGKPFGESSLAQAGVLAASLAAIGIALTSLLAPAQPPVRTTARNEARAPLATQPVPAQPVAAQPVAAAASTTVATPAATPSAVEPEPFRPMVTLDVEKPSPSEIRRSRPRAAGPAANRTAAAASSVVASAAVEPRAGIARPVSTRTPDRAERRLARRTDAGQDPVSKFAVRTGTSVWKAMRAVGRSLKRDGDQSYWATRSTARAGGGRRTAAVTNLGADIAPSDR